MTLISTHGQKRRNSHQHRDPLVRGFTEKWTFIKHVWRWNEMTTGTLLSSRCDLNTKLGQCKD